MANFSYALLYANTPFFLDDPRVVRASPVHDSEKGTTVPNVPRPFQMEESLIAELERKIPSLYLQDFSSPNFYPERKSNGLAVATPSSKMPGPEVRVGNFYYPTGAARWSVFRGFATSTAIKQMLAATNGSTSATFVMKCTELGTVESNYTISTPMHMLPPRPLAEHGGAFDGLYLVTLVDERFYYQFSPINLKPDQNTTWENLISQCASVMGVAINYSAISSVYLQPQADSQLWINEENVALLLDAIAYNIGRVVVREYNGSLTLLTPTESKARIDSNRVDITQLARLAGGDIFSSGGTIKAGNLFKSKNAVVPGAITFTFPKYVVGNDPVPHFLNSRYKNQRPSAWIEDSYGETYDLTVPIASGGPNTSGLTGTSVTTIHSTAKALYSGEINAGSDPLNASGLTALSLQLTQDLYNSIVLYALDEVYPGTYQWTPEGFHDIVWTYSQRDRLASTRIMRGPWNQSVYEMQHSTPQVDYTTETNTPIGVGGPSVAQSWRDTFSGNIATNVSTALASGDYSVVLDSPSYFPTDKRWKGQINSEKMLLEGTSGGTTVTVVQRGIDGTVQTAHSSGLLSQLIPNTIYGINLVTHGPMQAVVPGLITSGGIAESLVVPQTQTVITLSSGVVGINGMNHYSGRIDHFFPNVGFQGQNFIWVVERNNNPLMFGKRYDGQFGWYSTDTPAQVPVYLVTEQTASLGPPISGFPPPTTSGFSGYIPPVSGSFPGSGYVPPTSGGYPPAYPCNPIYLYNTDLLCVSGVLKLYRQRLTLGTYFGCLTQTPSNWFYVRDVGCCDCPTPPPPEPCVPGECEECTDPPYLWQINATGFTGLCAVFNRAWLLTQEDECVWSQTIADGDLEISVTITIAGGIAAVAFLYGDGTTNIANATYYATIIDGECCQILHMEKESESDCSCGDGAAPSTPCGNCITTPTTWSAYFSGGTNCYAVFNGGHTLSLIGDCIWHNGGTPPAVTVSLSVNVGNITVQFSEGNDTYANYNAVRTSGFDCCTPIEMTLTASSCPAESVGSLPTTITFTPNCTGSPGTGSCPDYITAIPSCCDTVPDCDPIPCEYCGDVTTTPIWWTFTLSGFSGACAVLNGNWTVYQVETGCEWKFISEDGAVFRLYFPSESSIILDVTYFEGDAGFSASFQGSFNGDCCNAISLTITGTNCGGSPNNTLVTPNCCNEEPVLYWWCVNNSTCQEAEEAPPGTTSGPYDTQAECEAVCGDIGTSWWCVQYSADSNYCIEAASEPPSTISGPHSSLSECLSLCPDDLVSVTCCAENLPAVMQATFSGSLAALGIVTLIWDPNHFGAGSGAWVGTASACGGTVDLEFYCENLPSTNLVLNIFGATFALEGQNATSCDPFLWERNGTAAGSTDPNCDGAFSVEIIAVE